MGRKLKRVPLDFKWPLKKVWKGYINPYYKLQQDCADCHSSSMGHSTGMTPEAARFYEQWYGYTRFDPVAYGAKPITRDHPHIRALAIRNVNNAPEFYMTLEEQQRARATYQRAGIDLIELMKTDAELKAELDRPPGEVEDLNPPGLVRIDGLREPAIQREMTRLYHDCFKGQWKHHLIQADVDALVFEGRLKDFTHRPRTPEQEATLAAQAIAGQSGYWLEEPNGHHPTADEVNDWSLLGMAHDAINAHVCLTARCAREGVTVECPRCKGGGHYWVDIEYDDLPHLTGGLLKPEAILAMKPVGKTIPAAMVEQLCEEWKDYDPPEGPGFQLWENTSEGSPISPVFRTLDELCAYAADNCSTFGPHRADAAEWRQMLDDGLVFATSANGDIFL